MENLTVEAQIALLRNATRWRGARNLHYWMLGLAVVLAVVGVVIWNPIPIVIAVFVGIVGIAERRAVPNVLNAIRAYETVQPSFGAATITISRWSDDDHYLATVREYGLPDWEIEFIPRGWSPAEGTHSARIWRLKPRGVPALAIVEDGVLIPRYDPKRV